MSSSRRHNSFLETLNRPVKQRPCDCPGCKEPGIYKAPRSRDRLYDYYWFCLDHVRDYNARWDYLKGLTVEQIENHIRNASVWERPTWPLGEAKRHEKILHETLRHEFFDDDKYDEDTIKTAPAPFIGEREALAVLDLQVPVDFVKIKARYRFLVKRHHPDANGGSQEAEEKIKAINQAFTVLRGIYGVRAADRS